MNISEEGAIGLIVGTVVFGLASGLLEEMANDKNWANRSVPFTLYLAATVFSVMCGAAAFGVAKLFTTGG